MVVWQVRLLIYIPCWINYAKGWQQIMRLRHQATQLEKSGTHIELEFFLSVNAVIDIDPIHQERFATLGENFRHFHTNLGDININLGFLDASRTNADLFWIVSPDDRVSDSALSRITEFLPQDSGLDFIVADEDGRGIRDITLTWSTLDFRVLSQASFGLVNGVIYRLSSFRPYLHHGLQASYTGWGQLAVFLGATKNPNGITGRILPSDFFYFRGDAKILSHESKVDNLRHYAHSFFGLVILISLLSPKPTIEIQRWVMKNWYRLGAYHRAYSEEKYGYVRLTDLRRLARVSIRQTNLLTRTLYNIFTRVNVAAFKRVIDRAQ